jgi:ABC-type branched-subunit amino acid transport system substrate-binding protein
VLHALALAVGVVLGAGAPAVPPAPGLPDSVPAVRGAPTGAAGGGSVDAARALASPPSPAPGVETVEDALTAARAARERGEGIECAARASWAMAAAESLLARGGGTPSGDRKRLEAGRDAAAKLLHDACAGLPAGDAACAAAWGSPVAELSLRFARAMLDAHRPADAAAEALALLAADPGGRRSGEAAALLKSAARPSAPAGGVHHSVYNVAALVPLTGDYSAYGQSMLAGLRLALSEGGSAARPGVRLTPYDTGSEAWQAAVRARQALEAGAGVFVGEVLSVPTLVLVGASQAHGVPLLSPSATEESVGEGQPAVFQTGLAEAEQGRALARYAVRELHARRIALAVAAGTGAAGAAPDTALAAGAGDFLVGFAVQARALQAAVIPVETPGGNRDARGAINELRRAQADAIVLPADPAQAEIWIAALGRERYDAKLLGSEALDPQNLHPDSQKDAEGMALVGLDYALPESVFARVDSLAHERYGLRADRFVRRGYLTGRLLAQALAGGAASPAMLTEALTHRALEPGAPGRPSRGFVRYPESEARVPIFLVRRGALVRVR